MTTDKVEKALPDAADDHNDEIDGEEVEGAVDKIGNKALR